MNAELLLTHFSRISDAPDAVPRLRQFVLDLSVRGKLVDPKPSEEPVSISLKRIQADIGARAKAGELKLRGPFHKVEPGEVLFDIPKEWCWTRLGALAEIIMGQSPPGSSYNKSGEGIPLINGPVEFTEGPFGKTTINQYTTEPTNLCEEGDLLLCVRGSTTGRTNIAGHRACIGRGVAAIRSLYADQFLRLYIWHHRASIIAMGRGIAFPSISRQQIQELPIPFPPLAEQHRIVAKVDVLMALCDRLEAAQRERESRRDRLTAATHHHLNNGADAENLRSHAQFFIGHLPRLTTRPNQIPQLRITVLHQAVRGMLVPQDPKEEAPDSLLKRMNELREDLVNNRVIRKPLDMDPISGSETPFTIPDSWRWVRWGQICDWITYGFTRPMTHVNEGPAIVTAKNVQDGFMTLDYADRADQKEFVALRPKDRPRNGSLLITKDGTIGRAAIVDTDEPFCINQSVAVLWLESCLLYKPFLLAVIRAPLTQVPLLKAAEGMAIKHLSITDFGKLLLPIPPLAEQHRIVAKVDELMALCDQLEARLTTAQTEASRLLESVLHNALNSQAERFESALST